MHEQSIRAARPWARCLVVALFLAVVAALALLPAAHGQTPDASPSPVASPGAASPVASPAMATPAASPAASPAMASPAASPALPSPTAPATATIEPTATATASATATATAAPAVLVDETGASGDDAGGQAVLILGGAAVLLAIVGAGIVWRLRQSRA